MQTKLTLRMDEEVIRKAKRWAASRGISLSKAVEEFLALAADANDDSLQGLDDWTRALLGAGRGTEPPWSDEEIEEELGRHWEEKHR
ncbi:DUF6364 family protein [Deferrisoma sp.]